MLSPSFLIYFFFIYRPLYSTSTIDYPSDQQERSRESLEPIFRQYKIDAYISGHVHLFERSFPLDNYKVAQHDYHKPDAPVYIINGAAGNLEGHPERIMEELPPYMAKREKATYGYGILRTDRTPAYYVAKSRNGTTSHHQQQPETKPHVLKKLSRRGVNATNLVEVEKRLVNGPSLIRLCHHFVAAGTSSAHPIDTLCITKDSP